MEADSGIDNMSAHVSLHLCRDGVEVATHFLWRVLLRGCMLWLLGNWSPSVNRTSLTAQVWQWYHVLTIPPHSAPHFLHFLTLLFLPPPSLPPFDPTITLSFPPSLSPFLPPSSLHPTLPQSPMATKVAVEDHVWTAFCMWWIMEDWMEKIATHTSQR